LSKFKFTIVEILKYSDWGCWIHFSWKFNYFVKISQTQVVVVTVSSSWDWDFQYETKFREQFAMELLWCCIMYHVSCFWFVSGWWFARLALYEKQKIRHWWFWHSQKLKLLVSIWLQSPWMSMCYKHKSIEGNFPAKGVGEKMLIFRRVYWRLLVEAFWDLCSVFNNLLSKIVRQLHRLSKASSLCIFWI
jgi:hypothetical protein